VLAVVDIGQTVLERNIRVWREREREREIEREKESLLAGH
jgi:hypothetical protein